MNQDTISKLAETVDVAAQTATPITMLTAANPMNIEDAYVVQRASMARRFDRGEALVGLKMGLTSVAKMQQMGVHDPIYGHLTDEMKRSSGDAIKMSEHCHPRVEPEIAFLIGSEISGPVTAAEAMEHVTGICGALEVIDSRYENFKFTLIDVVADNASSTRFFLGDKVVPADLDISNLGMVLELNGEVAETGSSAAILEHPARSLAALANMLHTVGETVPANCIVLAGGATKAIHLKAGDHAKVTIEELGSVELFVEP